MKLTEFSIKRLHNSFNVKIPIRNNVLILVGVNGIGKSTVLNLLYFFLSRQWSRMLEYEFEELIIKMDGHRLAINREEVEVSQAERMPRSRRSYPSNVFLRIEESRGTKIFDEFLAARHFDSRQLERFSSFYRIPHNYLARVQRDFIDSMEDESSSPAKRVWEHDRFIKSTVDMPALYLPTYRRIEKELQVLFPDIYEQLQRYGDKSARTSGRTTDTYTELVEFGMEDVRKQIEQALNILKESARASLNSLAGSYLRDVIRGEADTFDPELIRGLNDRAIERILSRVEEETLNDTDKKRLREVVSKIMVGKQTLEERELFVAHYFGKLVEIIKNLWDQEKGVVKFADTINSYLVGKGMIYEENRYTMKIMQSLDRVIDLQQLSSGEKQIVSLFSHLYLTENQKHIVFIDEPELSLSVDWQEKFLPDIVDSGRCEFLGAATHSPFIFDNKLGRYAVDLRDCMKEV